MHGRRLVAPPVAGERRLKMTYEEYLALLPEGVHAEWVRGEAIIFMPPKAVHQEGVTFFTMVLRVVVGQLSLGQVFVSPFEMHLPEQRVSREPDILFVANAHLDRLDGNRLTGPADLVVEVISDSTERYDRRDKFAEYARAGIPEYWMCDPRPGRRLIEPYTLVDGRYEPILPDQSGCFRSVVIPVFWFDPGWLRQHPLPLPLSVPRQILPEAF